MGVRFGVHAPDSTRLLTKLRIGAGLGLWPFVLTLSGGPLVSSLVRASPARSQLCWQPAAAYTAPALAAVRRAVTGTDPKTARLRTGVGLLQDSPGSVYVVTDETICHRAAVAIALVKGRSDTVNLYPVLTIKAGTLRYVLDDGNTQGGEFMLSFVADTSFRILGGIAN